MDKTLSKIMKLFLSLLMVISVLHLPSLRVTNVFANTDEAPVEETMPETEPTAESTEEDVVIADQVQEEVAIEEAPTAAAEKDKEFVKELELVTVKAIVKAGTFSEDVEFVVDPIYENTNEFAEAEEALAENGVKYDGIIAFDIYFKRVSDGEKIQPDDNVSISMVLNEAALKKVNEEPTEVETVSVTHITEDKEVVTVADVTDETEGTVEVTGTEEAVEAVEATFEVDGFSTFTLTWTNAETSEEEKATIHWGILDASGNFVELMEESDITMDTTAATISLLNNIEGYLYLDAHYCAPEQDFSDGVAIDSTLTKKDNGWECIAYVHNADETVTPTNTMVENGSNIYVTFYQSEGYDPTPAEQSEEIPAPSTTKDVQVNADGSATITLTIAGNTIAEDKSHYANVLVILDATRSMGQNGGANWTNAKAAMNALVETLTEGDNASNAGKIDFALVTYGRDATIQKTGGATWTKDNAAFKQTCAGINMVTTSGTNWEAGMRGGVAALAEVPDNDPTYVIFLTDGNPNTWYNGRGYRDEDNGTNYDNTGTRTGWDGNNDTAAGRSKDEARTIASSTYLYGIFTGSTGTPSGTEFNRLNDVITGLNPPLGPAQGGVKAIAASASTIQSEFVAIAETMLLNMSPTEVSVDDGIPALASISANVPGTPGGYDYYISTDGGNTFSEWEDAPGATYSSDNGVTWDLSEEKELDKDTVCRIVFTVWPSQEAYDIVANLNNGLIDYDELPTAVQNQISEKDGTYSLKTNTHLKTTYTFNDETYTDVPEELPQGSMPLVSYEMTVHKEWDDSINPRNRTDKVEFYLLVNGLYYQKDGTFKNTKDNAYILETEKEAWTDSVQIAPGFATLNEDGTLDVKESGHKYALEEIPSTDPDYEGYSQEFTTQTVRPMVINGTLTNLVLVDEDNPLPTEATKYVIGDETYYVSSVDTSTLTGTNHKTAELDITKAIDSTLSNKTAAELKEETFTYEVTFNVPADGDVSGINYWTYTPSEHIEKETWPLPEYGTGKPGAGYEPNEYTTSVEYKGVKNATTASGQTVTATVTLHYNEVIRFTNLPTGTTYTIVETKANGKDLSSQGYLVTNNTKSTNGTVTVNTATITGTIEEYNTRYYNRFENKIDAVDAEFEVTKKLVNHEWEESYKFTVDFETDTATNPLPDTTEVILDKNNKTKTFGKVRFTAPGTYTYTVTEDSTKDNVSYLTYPEEGTEVTVTVERNDETGKLFVSSITPNDNTNGTYTAATETSDAKESVVITNTYTPTPQTVPASFTKNVTVGTESANGATFNFTIAAVEAGNPMPANTSATVSYTKGETGTKTVTFGDIEFTEAGTYNYTITEAASAGWTVETSPTTWTVTVVDNGDGTLTATGTTVVIKNSYSAEPVKVSFPVEKVLVIPEGTPEPTDWTFTFTLSAEEGVPVPETKSYDVTKAAPKATFGDITFTAAGTYTYTIKESGKVDAVVNDKEATSGKTVTVTVVDNGDGTLTATADSTEQKPLQFMNNYAPIFFDPPVMKTVIGEGYNKDDTFSFKFEAKNGAPMPEGVDGSSMTVELKAGEEHEYGDVYLTKPGTYEYTISEVKTESTDYEFDDTVYELKFVITEDENGQLVCELTINGEKVDYTKLDPSTFEFTNIFIERVDVEVIKIWADANNAEGKRPEEIEVTLYAGDEKVETVKLNNENGWKYIWEGVPAKDVDRKEIKYTVKEDIVPEGYTMTNAQSEYKITITNTLKTPETGDKSNVGLWMTLFGASMAGTLGAAYVSLKKKKEEE